MTPQVGGQMQVDQVSKGGDARGGVYRYILAILAAMAALLLRGLLSPLLGESNPYHTIWAEVVFSAWYFGLGPSIVTTLVGAAGIWYWFMPRGHLFELKDPKHEVSGMLGFLIFSSLFLPLGEANRRSLARSTW